MRRQLLRRGPGRRRRRRLGDLHDGRTGYDPLEKAHEGTVLFPDEEALGRLVVLLVMHEGPMSFGELSVDCLVLIKSPTELSDLSLGGGAYTCGVPEGALSFARAERSHGRGGPERVGVPSCGARCRGAGTHVDQWRDPAHRLRGGRPGSPDRTLPGRPSAQPPERRRGQAESLVAEREQGRWCAGSCRDHARTRTAHSAAGPASWLGGR